MQLADTRLEKIQAFLQAQSLDALFISTPAHITYLTGFDFLSPTEREAYVLITDKNQYVVSSFLYKDELMQFAPDFTFLDISSAGGKPWWEYVQEISEKERCQKVGFEANNLTVAEYNALHKTGIPLSPVSLTSLRDQKDEKEIEAITRACHIGDNVFTAIQKYIHPKVTEKEIALEIDTLIRKNGAEPSFPTIVAFGKNTAVPHHKTNNTTLLVKDSILLDFGVKVDTYCSDMTRMLFIGKITEEEKHAYTTLRDAQEQAITFLKKNASPIAASAVDKKARGYLIAKGYPSFPHSLGHSIGIEVHDGFRLSPISKTKLIPGMVFSIEPGIYLSGELGMRIEDTVVLTENGLEILTTSSKEMILL